ncbi:MAG: hypothetical protein HUJ72_00680 [Blautia sp.]|nr:hypothetical protein [Blautia sp.]
MQREIGSEFWQQSCCAARPRILFGNCDLIDNYNIVHVLSGRTALDFIIRDIKATRMFETVALPSYCCDSMIEPFLRNGVKVHFYPVNEHGIEVFDQQCDAILLLDYFGYADDAIVCIADAARKRGQIVIYDATHYLADREIAADYVFCSYRKWQFCSSAYVRKNNDDFHIPIPKKRNQLYIEMRMQAAALKEKYMMGLSEDKDSFLYLFSQAEELLEGDYVDYAGSYTQIEKEEIIVRRQENAAQLIEGIRDIPEIKLWKNKVHKEDTPLFVPIFLSEERRNELRKYLIHHSIYCPVHWPLTELHGTYRAIFGNELSLICDQRYTEDDIDREIETIRKFFTGRNGQ